MLDPSPLAEGFDALARGRQRERTARERHRGALRSIPWLTRVVFGVLPVWSSALMALWFFGRGLLDWPAVAPLGVLFVHAALACCAMIPHTRPLGGDRRLSTVALGVSVGLVVVYALPAACIVAWSAIASLSVISSEQVSLDFPLPTLALLATPLSIVAWCALDVTRDVAALRGRAFGFRDCAWILLGLLLAYASGAIAAMVFVG